MRRISVIYVLVALSTASYDNPSDSSPDGVQAFNPSHAPDPSCRTNEEYIQCATHCEPSCSNPNPVCIRSCAPAQCQCGYGYVRNEYGECVDTSGCPAQKEEATPSSTEIPMEETTTFSPPSAPQYVNPPSPPPFDDEPSTTTTQQYDSVPTEATASIDDETPAPKTESESPSEQTASPSSDYSSGGNGEKEDTVPSQDDDDVILVVSRLHPILLSPLSLSTSTGGPCGENTCRVGFKCDDSTAVGARCIPFDTRARSSCSSIRCRPGWSCVIAMDGPRCYRNEVLGLANANESTSGPLPVSDYSADSPSLPPLAEDGKKCSDIICPLGFSCFEDSSSPHPFCRSITEGRESPAPLCSDIQCAPNESCTDNHNGPVCTKNAPATCASTSCLTGSSCVDHPEGARCEGGPVVFAGKTCADSVCPDLHQCFDSLEGASCYPIPTDPVESISVPLKCDQMTCNEGEKCRDDENGGVCTPQEEDSTAENEVPAGDEPQSQREGVSDCEHTSCGTGEHCAVDFEGNPYCRRNEGVADVAEPVTSSSESESAPESPSCRTTTCTQDELCVEESTGPRCVPTLRRGISTPGYRRRL